MPVDPYPISITAYDSDNTTLYASANVVVRNGNTGDELTETTNSSGQAVVDLANFTNEYTNKDRIIITVYKEDSSENKVGDDYHEIDTSVGNYDSTIYVVDGIGWQSVSNETRLCQLTVGNGSASNYWCRIYERAGARKISPLRVAANSTELLFYGDNGYQMTKGFAIVRGNEDLEIGFKIG